MVGSAWRVQLMVGDGVVSRTGSTVVLCRPSTDAQERWLDELLALVEETAEGHPDSPGRRVARRTAGLIAQAEPDDVPDLCVLSQGDDGVVALLVGAVQLEILSSGSTVDRLSGRDTSSWVDKIIAGSFDRLTVSLGEGRHEIVGQRTNLQEGVVLAGGLVVSPMDATGVNDPPAAPPVIAVDPPPPADMPVAQLQAPTSSHVGPTAPVLADNENTSVAERPFAPFVSIDLAASVPEEQLRPLPNATEPTAVAAPQASAVQVQGIVCSRGHFNDPTGIFCSSCGISLVQQTHNLVAGSRPPLGVVVLDDGSVFTLNIDYVMGREPENADEVRTGRAIAMPLADPDQTLSRVHASITLSEWDVQIVDLHSANGTFVAAPQQTEWTRLPPGAPTTIRPGTRVTLGGRSLVFDSPHKA